MTQSATILEFLLSMSSRKHNFVFLSIRLTMYFFPKHIKSNSKSPPLFSFDILKIYNNLETAMGYFQCFTKIDFNGIYNEWK